MKKWMQHIRPSIEITTVMGCRVNCKFCPQKSLVEEYFREDKGRASKMSFDTFRRCIDKMPKHSTIIFSGASEPMLNDEVYEMILYASQRGGDKLRLLTTLEGLTNAGLDQIKDVSFEAVVLHAPDADGFAKITVDEDYFQILDKILSLKKPDGSRFIDYCNCQGRFHPEFLKHIKEDIPGLNVKTQQLHDRAGNIGESTSLVTKENKGIMICRGSFPVLNHFMLMPDGTVCLCCMDFGMKHVLGNLLTDSYKQLRKSQELKRVQRGMINPGTKDILCRNCSYGYSFRDLFKK